MKKLVVLTTIALLSGCSLPQRVKLGGSDGPGNKVVTAKEAPATLVAVDGTICHVTAGRFERISTGDRAWCGWQKRGAALQTAEQPLD